jgi:hypothetical protein
MYENDKKMNAGGHAHANVNLRHFNALDKTKCRHKPPFATSFDLLRGHALVERRLDH